MKIAFVHDYFFQFGGAEKVVEKFLEKYPEMDIYTSFYVPQKFNSSEVLTSKYQQGKIYTTWLQKLFSYEIALKYTKHLFWLYPLVMSTIVIRNYDVVVMSSTYCAKNVRYKNCKKVIHYCHSPVRFLHGLVTETDHKSLSWLYRALIPVFTFWLKWMDLRAVAYLNRIGAIWVGNSKFVQKMIKEVYHTNSIVIYPPTEVDKFLNVPRKLRSANEEFYFSHGRISFHKRIDLAIKACLVSGKRLKISGQTGFKKEMDDLKQIVSNFESANPDKSGLIEFLGRTTDQQYIELLSQAKAFLFPGKEDSGIAPIEALASGLPVIAYQDGGALEYVQDGLNGIFFYPQTETELMKAIQKFELNQNWDEVKIRETSKQFSPKKFYESFANLIES